MSLWHNLRYAIRVFLRTPALTVVAVLCLGLGVGANTAVFSVVNNVLLRPLPYRNPGRLVAVFETTPRGKLTVCPADFLDWREQVSSFESIAAYRGWNPNLTSVDDAENLAGVRASGDLFELLGVAPMRGRVFRLEDETPRARMVVLSHALWQRKFGGDASVVGSTLRLNGEGYEVAGIMPPEFGFPNREVEIWAPLWLNPGEERGEHSLSVVARLRNNVTQDRARAEVGALMRRLSIQYSGGKSDCGADLTELRDWYVGSSTRELFWVLVGAAGLVLLLACANVSNLLLARGQAREQELMIRASLGAGRGRLVSQLLTENLLLSVLGGGLGLALALWGRDALVALVPDELTDSFGPVVIDAPVFGYSLALTLLSGLIFGIAPAIRNSRVHFNLHQASSRFTRSPLRAALLVTQTALAFVLLTGAGLLARSFVEIYRIDMGFSVENVQTAQINLPEGRYSSESAVIGFFDQALTRIAAIGGVQAAGAVTNLPLGGGGNGSYISFEGRPAVEPGSGHPGAARQIVTPGYFSALRIKLIQGRLFTDSDRENAGKVVIVNEAMAKLYWPGASPVGSRIKRGTLKAPFPWMTVVGVVADNKHGSLTGEVTATVFLPLYQNPSPWMTLVVRAESGPGTQAAALRAVVREIDPEQPLSKMRRFEEVYADMLSGRRMVMLWMGLFAALALALAAAGIYGVVHYAVSRRTREFGIRIALGADNRALLYTAIRQGMTPVALGVAIGVAAAVGATRLLAAYLYRVEPTDASTFAGAVAVFAAVALAASYFPARRSAGLDPVVTLRSE